MINAGKHEEHPRWAGGTSRRSAQDRRLQVDPIAAMTASHSKKTQVC